MKARKIKTKTFLEKRFAKKSLMAKARKVKVKFTFGFVKNFKKFLARTLARK